MASPASDSKDAGAGVASAADGALEARGSVSGGVAQCATRSDADPDSTIQTVVDPSVIELTETALRAGVSEQLRRWCSSLQPRFACGEQHSSTNASWVFRGTDLDSGTAVAVKLLKESHSGSRNAFIAEALLLSELEHPGIVRYVAHGELPSGGAYIITEWLEGEDLRARLQRGRLSTAEAITFITRVANILAVTHARGVVHLDLKPSNIFLAGGDLSNVRLLDFGIAYLTRSVSSDANRDLVAGTPGYMAPEQVLCKELSPATDVFALGCILYRCLTGRKIFDGNTREVLARTVADTVALPDSSLLDVHPALAALLARLLRPDPAERPADGAGVLAALAALPPELLDSVAPSARVLLSPSGLTAAERVPTTVVLVRHAGEDQASSGLDGRKRYSSYFEILGNGTWLALPRGNATPVDQALHAARLALDVRAHWPRAAIAVVAARTVDRTPTPQLRDLLAEAETCLETARSGQIVLDAASAALVPATFRLAAREGSGALLLAEESAASVPDPARESSALCLGRETELDTLVAIAHDAFSTPRARVVLVTGLAGIGKSSLLGEFLKRLSFAGSRPGMWSAYADPMSAGSALHLVSAIVDAAPAPAGAGLTRLLRPDDADPRQTGDVRPAGSVNAVHRAFADLFAAQLEQGPLVLRLEDIHWADLGSLRAVDHLLSAMRDRPLLIVATARPEVRELYPDLWLRRSVHGIHLNELLDADADRVVTLRLGREIGAAVRARILRRARGNAFLLHELIRAEAEGRGDEVLETALGVVQSHIRALAPDARRVLRAASILGDPFTPRGVTFLLGEGSDERDVEGWLTSLVSREVLSRRDDGQSNKPALVFAHALVRDAAYDMLTPSDRTLGHRLAARWLESTERANPMITAQHYARAGEAAGAGRWYFRATVEAFEIGDFGATAGAAELALANELSQHERGHVQALAAHAYRLVGNVEKSKHLSAEALRNLPPNSPLWREAARTAMMAGASAGRHRDG
jgi:eukaryotic-like serine/threonine-protein kinase